MTPRHRQSEVLRNLLAERARYRRARATRALGLCVGAIALVVLIAEVIRNLFGSP